MEDLSIVSLDARLKAVELTAQSTIKQFPLTFKSTSRKNSLRLRQRTSPTMAGGTSRKNKHRTARRKRRKEREQREHLYQQQKPKIDTSHPQQRTLRKSMIKRLDHDRKKRHYYMPWASDVGWRYKPFSGSRSHLLALPCEIRQQILLDTLHASLHDMTGKEIGKHIGELCAVAPIVRMDMVWVSARWKDMKREKRNTSDSGALQPISSLDVETIISSMQSKTKSLKKRKRPQRCWYCRARHMSPWCPLEHEQPEFWDKNTRVYRTKRVRWWNKGTRTWHTRSMALTQTWQGKRKTFAE